MKAERRASLRIALIAMSRSLELRVQLEAHRQRTCPESGEPPREPARYRVHHAVRKRDAVGETPDHPQAGHGPERLEFRERETLPSMLVRMAGRRRMGGVVEEFRMERSVCE